MVVPRGSVVRSHELAATAVACATGARELGWEPDPQAQDLLDVVQAWALTCSDQFDDALGPLRRVHRRVHEDGGLWLRGFTDLALGRLLARMGERGGWESGCPDVRPAAQKMMATAAATAATAAPEIQARRRCRPAPACVSRRVSLSLSVVVLFIAASA